MIPLMPKSRRSVRFVSGARDVVYAIAALYGDMAETYLVVDRIGIRVLRDPYTNKPFVGFYVTKRVGGFLADSNAIKLFKFSA